MCPPHSALPYPTTSSSILLSHQQTRRANSRPQQQWPMHGNTCTARCHTARTSRAVLKKRIKEGTYKRRTKQHSQARRKAVAQARHYRKALSALASEKRQPPQSQTVSPRVYQALSYTPLPCAHTQSKSPDSCEVAVRSKRLPTACPALPVSASLCCALLSWHTDTRTHARDMCMFVCVSTHYAPLSCTALSHPVLFPSRPIPYRMPLCLAAPSTPVKYFAASFMNTCNVRSESDPAWCSGPQRWTCDTYTHIHTHTSCKQCQPGRVDHAKHGRPTRLGLHLYTALLRCHCATKLACFCRRRAPVQGCAAQHPDAARPNALLRALKRCSDCGCPSAGCPVRTSKSSDIFLSPPCRAPAHCGCLMMYFMSMMFGK